MSEPTYSTGQAAAQASLSRKALRLYEQRGLLPTPTRTPAGYRRYRPADVDTLVFIRRARTLGLHLDDIAEILSLHQRGQAPCPNVRCLLDRRITEIEATLAELNALRTHLVGVRNRPAPPDGPERDVCPLISGENDDRQHS